MHGEGIPPRSGANAAPKWASERRVGTLVSRRGTTLRRTFARVRKMAETVRACRREDVPSVAGMFARVFQPRDGSVGHDLPRYFENVLFPGGADESRSRVFTDAKGDVRGFIGIWPRRMVLRGRTI